MADRRSFFKELLREAASVVQEVNAALRFEEDVVPDWQDPPPVPARPARGDVGEDTLLALCREVGLEHRAADVRRLARTSVRLTGGEDGGASRLGGSPDVPPGFAWPTRQGRELGFLGQLDLERVRALDPSLPVPRTGLLLFFYDFGTRPSGSQPAHRGSCRVLVLEGERSGRAADEEHRPVLRSMPVELSRELMLPGAWSFQGELLDLTAEEMDSWDALRERLAHAQSVELEETSADRMALHRLLGYQDEFGRELELDCQLATSGRDADTYYEPRTDHEADAREWRLLLQLSTDDALGWPSNEEFERLYVCIRDTDLIAGNFGAAWAILR